MTHNEWVARFRIAAYLVVAAGLVVTIALSNGCATPVSPESATKAPVETQPSTAPSTAPTATTGPTTGPTSGPSANFDGTYGPGTFAGGTDSCVPPFFGNSFLGSVLVINNMTFESVFENQRRDATCVYNPAALLATCSGRGVVGTAPATWDDFIQFSRDASNQPHAVVTQILHLTERNNCGKTYVSVVLNRQ